MEKKYQIFISSTYTDLKKERQAVYSAILDANCIPAGMENFAASDKNQFEIIKETMDLCDYYILIVGKRYGTIDEKTGLSFTEMEFDYATQNNIPKLCFVKNNLDTDDENLKRFISKVTGDRMVSFWDNKMSLKSEVLNSINHAIKDFDRPGWIRGTYNENSKKETNQLSLLETKIVNMLKENDYVTPNQIANNLGYSKSAVLNKLNVLIEKGYITRVGSIKHSKWDVLK